MDQGAKSCNGPRRGTNKLQPVTVVWRISNEFCKYTPSKGFLPC